MKCLICTGETLFIRFMKIPNWFRSDKTPEKNERQENVEQEQSPANIHRSPVLKLLSKKMAEDRKFSILDTGSALNENIEFFSQFRCKLYIDDFYSSFRDFDFFAPADECSPENLFSYLLPFQKGTRFDIILVWDVLNYMKLEECGHLFNYLARFSHPGTVLFAMVYTRREISEVPISFRIENRERIHYDFNSSILKNCPRHEGPSLENQLGRFQITNSYLLRNGFKEYLFTCS